MKKLSISLISFLITLTAFTQTNTIVSEDFESTIFPPNGWTTIDHDGDGLLWYRETNNGNSMAASESWLNVAIEPHNYMVSPQIDLTVYSADDNIGVYYKVGASGSSYFQENYKLAISTTGSSHSDFENGDILIEETLTSTESGWALGERVANLSEYAGSTIHLAWVHYSCTNQDRLLIDDILVYQGDDPTIDPPTPYTSWLVGSTDDVTPENHTSGILLAGGGSDNDEAMVWLINRADGGDIVVIRASDTDGYNNYLFTELGITINSVETILIDSREAAEHPYVEQQIRNAEALFIAGGDQYDYYQYWKDTPVMDAINYLINDKGVAIGGTSAGMAILGKVYYTPSGTGAQSSTVLNNPYHSSTNIIGRDNFIDADILNNTITDTHFDARDRSGRLFTFMARMVTDWGIEAKGIAANEYTAVCIDVDGKAYVYGNSNYDDFAYFLIAQGCQPETCESGLPLTWNCSGQAVRVLKLKGDNTNPPYFDLTDWTNASAGEWEYWYSIDGVLTKTGVSSIHGKTSNTLNIFPNPATNWFYVDMSESDYELIEITSISGQHKKSQKLNQGVNRIDISDLPNGAYLTVVANKFGLKRGILVVSK